MLDNLSEIPAYAVLKVADPDISGVIVAVFFDYEHAQEFVDNIEVDYDEVVYYYEIQETTIYANREILKDVEGEM